MALKRLIPKNKVALTRFGSLAVNRTVTTDGTNLELKRLSQREKLSVPPRTLHAWNRLHPPLGDLVANKAYAGMVAQMPHDVRKPFDNDPSPTTDLESYQSALAASSKWTNEYVAKQMKTATGEAAYTLDTLKIYDALVWGHNSPFHWRIQQEEVQGLYNDCMLQSHDHCEIGVGTGLFLAELDTSQCSKLQKIFLMDLQKFSLEVTEKRLKEIDFYRQKVKIDSLMTSVLDDIPTNLQGSFDTVAANFLVHCLPPGEDVVYKTFYNCASMLRPSGLFFGSSILGKDLMDDGAKAGSTTVQAMELYNQMGVFGCKTHTYKDFSSILHDLFEDVEIWRVGYCVAWKARFPKSK